MSLYKFAPYILGIAYAFIVFVGLILHMFGLNDLFLWSGAIILFSAFGFYSGILLRNLKIDSNTDQLTKLWNRRYLQKRLSTEYIKVQCYRNLLCVAMIDIDNFKEINDTYGHAIGDEFLIEVTNILRNSVRKVDTVARWGGDEFIIVLPDTNNDDAEKVLERIRSAVELRFSKQISLSIGFTMVNPNINLMQVLAAADKALYQAKQIKNTIVMDKTA